MKFPWQINWKEENEYCGGKIDREKSFFFNHYFCVNVVVKIENDRNNKESLNQVDILDI